MSRKLQGIRRTIEMNPSLETLRRILRELRHLLRNEHPRSQDYIGMLDDLKMRLENSYYLRAQIKAVYLRETHIICARRYVGFSQINWVFLKKLTLSADNVVFFQKNLLHLRETHII